MGKAVLALQDARGSQSVFAVSPYIPICWKACWDVLAEGGREGASPVSDVT